jgi:hypothetical protein
MNPFIQQMVNYKINHITSSELISLASQYNVTLSSEQATQILQILRAQQIDIYNNTQRIQIMKKIEKVVGRSKAQQINQIFNSFVRN